MCHFARQFWTWKNINHTPNYTVIKNPVISEYTCTCRYVRGTESLKYSNRLVKSSGYISQLLSTSPLNVTFDKIPYENQYIHKHVPTSVHAIHNCKSAANGPTCSSKSQHTLTHSLNGRLSGITRLSRYQKSKTNLDFTEARDSEWQWHQLGHMPGCTSLQTDNHTSTPPLSFLQARCPSCWPTNSIKALNTLLVNLKTGNKV